MVAVGKRLRGRDHDRIAGVHAHGVEIFHVADGDAGVSPVAHHLVLDLLPSPQGALDEDLVDWRRREATQGDTLEVGVGGHEPSTGPAERVRRADDEREAVERRKVPDLFDRFAHPRDRDRLAHRLEHLFEGLAVFGLADCVDRRAEHPDPVPVEHACIREVGREVEARLTTQSRQQRVGSLALDDPLYRLNRQRLEVHAVGDFFVGHDRGGVRVDQHGLDALFAKRLARLRAGVVELGGLADHDRPRTEDQNLARSGRLGHSSHGAGYGRPAADHVDKAVVQVLVVLRTWATFGVVLDAEGGQRAVAEALDRAVVQVALRDVEIAVGDRRGIDLELVVLTRDVDVARVEVFDRVVRTVVAVRQPRSRSSGGAAHDLVTEADAEHRDLTQRFAREVHRPIEDGGIAGAVRQHEPVCAARAHVRPGRRMRKHHHPASALAQRPQDVGLHAIVDHRDQQALAVASLASSQLGRHWLEPLFPARPRSLRDQVLLGQRCHALGGVGKLGQPRRGRRSGLVDEDRSLGSVGSDVSGQRPGVDVSDSGHVPPAQVLVERRLARVMAGRRASPPPDQRTRPGSPRLRVRIADSVIALQRVGHTHHLARVGRIGEHRLVAGHRGVEDQLALAYDICAERRADEGAAVFKDQESQRFPIRQRSPPGRCRPPRRSGPRCALRRRWERSCPRSRAESVARGGRGR